MKNKEKDYEYLETSPELLRHGLRQITRPKRLGVVPDEEKNTKNRVTIYFDSDIVRRFKQMGESSGVGYQTLMNQALRRVVDSTAETSDIHELKVDLLKDKKFLKQLKAALSL